MGITAQQIDRLTEIEAERKELRKALIAELSHQLRVVGYRPLAARARQDGERQAEGVPGLRLRAKLRAPVRALCSPVGELLMMKKKWIATPVGFELTCPACGEGLEAPSGSFMWMPKELKANSDTPLFCSCGFAGVFPKGVLRSEDNDFKCAAHGEINCCLPYASDVVVARSL